MSEPESLEYFVRCTKERVVRRVGHSRFSDDLVRLGIANVEWCFAHSHSSDWAQPLGLFYACYRSFGRNTDEQAIELGAFLTLYLLAADLFDDVEDDDLAGKAYEGAGSAVATNSALTFLVVGLDALRISMELERSPERRLCYLELFNRVSLVAVSAQHKDLVGAHGSHAPCDAASHACMPSREDLLDLYAGKTSSVALFAECGALLGGADQGTVRLFERVGSDLARMVQLVDDVRDVFGKALSPDLVSGKWTFPMVCFLERASTQERARLGQLRELAQSAQQDVLPEIRELLFESGAIAACAEVLDELRAGVHERIAGLVEQRSEHRMLLFIADTLASALYDPEPVPATARLITPVPAIGQASFARDVHVAADRFLRAMRPFGAPERVVLRPWHRPLYLFEPASGVVYYPDLDGLAGEIVPFFAQQLGQDLAGAVRSIRRAAPLLVAHELVHAWRSALGLLGSDAWHEEHVANQVAWAYAARLAPDSAAACLEASRCILTARASVESAEQARLLDALVANAGEPSNLAVDYDLDLADSASVHARMMVRFASERPALDACLARYLSAEFSEAAE